MNQEIELSRMDSSLTERLTASRKILQRQRWLISLCRNLFGFAIVSIALAGLNRLFPLQETTAFVLLLAVFLFFACRFAWTTFRTFLYPPSLPELAEVVEKRNHKWMDALICAVEQELRPEHKRRSLERSLITKMRYDTADVDFTSDIIPSAYRWKAVAAWAILLLFLAWPATQNAFILKGGYFFGDLVSAQQSGLQVLPGDEEVPLESDLTIHAEVLRWETTAEIEYVDENGSHRFPLNTGADAGHFFTFYALTAETRYRIHTPSLRSPWYELSPYVPPAIDAARMRIVPPAYTGLEEEIHSELIDVSAVEGSRVEWELSLPEGINAFWKTGQEREAMNVLSSSVQQHQEVAQGDLSYRFVVRDAEDREARTPDFLLSVHRDYPPVIEVVRPNRDIDAAPDETVEVAAEAIDDFGLEEITLNVSVSGQRRVVTPLFQAEEGEKNLREKAVSATLDIENLEAGVGDVITYFFTATDNREPEAQRARSEIFFIEIKEEIDPEDSLGDEGDDEEEMNIRALVLELKRLIRLSWDAIAADEERAPRIAEELALSMEALRIESRHRQQEAVGITGQEEGNWLVDLFNQANERLETAGRLIAMEQIEEAIPPQEQALANFLAIEAELMQNQSQSTEPSEDPDASGQTAGQPESDHTELEEEMEELQQLIRDVQQLADGQASQNRALRQLASDRIDAEAREGLEGRQEALRTGAEDAGNRASELPGAREAARELSTAASSMERSRRNIEEDSLAGAERDGSRARASLLAALENLEENLAQLTGNEVNRLVRQAEQLAQAQGEAAQGSRGMAADPQPSPDEMTAMQEEQAAIQEAFEALLSSISDTSLNLADEHPEAAEALSSAVRSAQDSQLAGEMARAGNALLYRRLERAAELQESAASGLEGVAQSLQEASKSLPALSREQLAEAIRQMQQAGEEVRGLVGEPGAGERLDQIRESAGRRLGGIGDALNDETLQEMGATLQGPEFSGPGGPNPLRMGSLLQAAGRALEQQLLAIEIERRARLNRQTAEPPEKYRNLVEEYFKTLSESP